MRTFTGAHQDWLTVVQLPAYAPDLNPVEGAWANMKNSLGNLGGCSTPDRLAAIIKNRLKRIQYRPALIDGFLARPDSESNPYHRRYQTLALQAAYPHAPTVCGRHGSSLARLLSGRGSRRLGTGCRVFGGTGVADCRIVAGLSGSGPDGS
jgi:hypothetical protein